MARLLLRLSCNIWIRKCRSYYSKASSWNLNSCCAMRATSFLFTKNSERERKKKTLLMVRISNRRNNTHTRQWSINMWFFPPPFLLLLPLWARKPIWCVQNINYTAGAGEVWVAKKMKMIKHLGDASTHSMWFSFAYVVFR